MPASTVLSSIRTPLATALASVSANVYSYVPEAVQVPAVILVPDSPYLELKPLWLASPPMFMITLQKLQ